MDQERIFIPLFGNYNNALRGQRLDENSNQGSGKNRRAHPRVNFNLEKTLTIQHTMEASIFDVSEGGASFLSEAKYEIGSEVTIGSGVLWIQARVLACVELPQEDSVNPKYKVRCQFETVYALL